MWLFLCLLFLGSVSADVPCHEEIYELLLERTRLWKETSAVIQQAEELMDTCYRKEDLLEIFTHNHSRLKKAMRLMQEVYGDDYKALQDALSEKNNQEELRKIKLGYVCWMVNAFKDLYLPQERRLLRMATEFFNQTSEACNEEECAAT